MRLLRVLGPFVFWILLTAQASPTPTQSPSPSPSPRPSPTPTQPNAFISLDVTAGDLNTVINVTGGQFLPNEDMSLYWDTPSKVAGSAHSDGNGNFNVRVKPFAGDPPGQHKLCASVAPNPCAFFSINAPPATPSPSPSPTESPSASPESTPGATASPTPAAATLNGFDIISRPPFVFLPIAGAVAIGLAVAFWLFSVLRRPRQVALPSAAVVHRAMRPDYSAGFGTPPGSPARQSEPSAWDAPASPQAQANAQPHSPSPPTEPAPTPPAPESELEKVEWGPPVEWGTGSSDWGFPEPPLQDDLPEPPQPGD